MGVGRPTKSRRRSPSSVRKPGVVAELRPRRGELVEGGDQHLGDVASAVGPEPAALVGDGRRRPLGHRAHRQLSSPSSSRSLAPGSSARISASPTRMADAPASTAARTWSRVAIPLSITDEPPGGDPTQMSPALARRRPRASPGRARSPRPPPRPSRAPCRGPRPSGSRRARPGPRSRAAASIATSSFADRHAAISRTASAPAARDSISSEGWIRKSLRSTGRSHAIRAARRSASEPWKCAGSVSTEIAAAPAEAYARACAPGSRSAIAPADGDARLTSAITAGRRRGRGAPRRSPEREAWPARASATSNRRADAVRARAVARRPGR